eukprot:3302619-Rhodomonas_salina.1
MSPRKILILAPGSLEQLVRRDERVPISQYQGRNRKGCRLYLSQYRVQVTSTVVRVRCSTDSDVIVRLSETPPGPGRSQPDTAGGCPAGRRSSLTLTL